MELGTKGFTTISIVVKSVTPLIQHQYTGLKIKDYTSEESKKKMFEAAQYRDENSRLYQPSEHFERCFQTAALNFNLKGKSTYHTIIKSAVIIEPEQILHKPNTKVEPMTSVVRIPPGPKGSRVPMTRAVIKKWELEFTMKVLDERINFDVLKEIVAYGGMFVGIGAWRPKYGRFDLVKFEVVKA
jgi:hypothetical protein